MPRLIELYEKLFGVAFDDAHDAAFDVDATAKSYFGLLAKKVVSPFDSTPLEEIEYEAPDLGDANFSKQEKKKTRQICTLSIFLLNLFLRSHWKWFTI